MLKRLNKGFSLIELLVVIAIIAILAAILFPIMSSAKAKANEIKCASNLKQIATATSLYMSDTGGRFPPFAKSDRTWEELNQNNWFTLTVKYSKTALLGMCPSDTSVKPVAVNKTNLDPNKMPPVGYWKNVYTDYRSCTDGRADGRIIPPPMETDIRYTRTTVYLMDGPALGGGNHTYFAPPTVWPGQYDPRYQDKNYPKLAQEAEERHSKAANVLFCDWHVKLVKPKEWNSTRKDTGDDNPLKLLGIVSPPDPWCNKNDGSHPWFRGD